MAQLLTRQEIKSIFRISVVIGIFAYLLVKDAQQAVSLFIGMLILLPILTVISKKIGLSGSIIWPEKWDFKRFWNPKITTIFTPRQFGFGWSFNFAVFLNPRASLFRRIISLVLGLLLAYVLVAVIIIILLSITNQPLPEDFWFLLR